MEENLRSKTFWGIIWSYVNRFGTQLIAIVPTMILARLIAPSEYGLLAMTAVFTGVASMLADGGFGNALVQKKDADHLDFCSVFYLNLVICSVIYILFWFLAPFFASFFYEVRLIWIIRITSLNIILGAIGQIHGIIFKKNIEYKKPAIRNIFVQLVSAALALCMAFGGYGVWALVVQGLSQTLLGSIANWVISTWRPSLCFSFYRLRLLFNFGSMLLLRSLIDYVFDKLYDVIIGRYYSASSLAYYNKGTSTVSLFSGTFWGVFGGVVFPAFVKMQDDNNRLRYNVRRFVKSASLLFSSIMLCVLVLADSLFKMMYSSKWDTAIPYFRLLCLSALILPLIQIVESVLWAKGESGKILYLSVMYKILIFVSISLTWKYGIGYMIVGQFVCEMIELLILVFCTHKLIDYGFGDFYQDVWENVFSALFLAAILILFDKLLFCVFLSHDSIFFTSMIRLVLGSMFSITVFFSLHKFLGLDSYKELISFLTDNVGNNKLIEWISPVIR